MNTSGNRTMDAFSRLQVQMLTVAHRKVENGIEKMIRW